MPVVAVDLLLGGAVGGAVAIFVAVVFYALNSRKLKMAEGIATRKDSKDALTLCRDILEEQHLRDAQEIEGLMRRIDNLESSLDGSNETKRRQAAEITRLQSELHRAEDRILGMENRIVELFDALERLRRDGIPCECGRAAKVM